MLKIIILFLCALFLYVSAKPASNSRKGFSRRTLNRDFLEDDIIGDQSDEIQNAIIGFDPPMSETSTSFLLKRDTDDGDNPENEENDDEYDSSEEESDDDNDDDGSSEETFEDSDEDDDDDDYDDYYDDNDYTDNLGTDEVYDFEGKLFSAIAFTNYPKLKWKLEKIIDATRGQIFNIPEKVVELLKIASEYLQLEIINSAEDWEGTPRASKINKHRFISHDKQRMASDDEKEETKKETEGEKVTKIIKRLDDAEELISRTLRNIENLGITRNAEGANFKRRGLSKLAELLPSQQEDQKRRRRMNKRLALNRTNQRPPRRFNNDDLEARKFKLEMLDKEIENAARRAKEISRMSNVMEKSVTRRHLISHS